MGTWRVLLIQLCVLWETHLRSLASFSWHLALLGAGLDKRREACILGRSHHTGSDEDSDTVAMIQAHPHPSAYLHCHCHVPSRITGRADVKGNGERGAKDRPGMPGEGEGGWMVMGADF